MEQLGGQRDTVEERDGAHQQTPSARSSRFTTMQEPVGAPGSGASHQFEQKLKVELADVMDHALDGADRMARAASLAARKLRAQLAMILVRVTDGGRYVRAAHFPAHSERAAADVPLSIVARVEAGGSPLSTDAVVSDEDDEDETARRRVSVICTPLEVQGDVVGAIYLERAPGSTPFNGTDLMPVALLARHVAERIAQDLLEFQVQCRAAWEQSVGRSAGPELVGRSDPFVRMIKTAEFNATDPDRVLIEGRLGSGRRLLAQYLHQQSPKSAGPFVVAHCPTMSQDLHAATLFGQRVGATQGQGLFQEAEGGTLCIAEISHLSHKCQSQLAHTLGAREYWPVGDPGAARRVRCQVIVTTSESLDLLAADDRLLPALRTELAGRVIHVPALKDRSEDVRPLGQHFAAVYGRRLFGRVIETDPRALAALEAYTWPGNIAEFSNVIERAVLLAGGRTVRTWHLPQDVVGASRGESAEDFTVRSAEKAAFIRALNAVGWKKGAAKDLLGISWPTMTKKYRDYGLEELKPADPAPRTVEVAPDEAANGG